MTSRANIVTAPNELEKKTWTFKLNKEEDLSLENILNVSPNPTSGVFNINVNLPENEEIAINVYNSVGQQIINVENGSINKGTYAVDITNQANGIYYVQMNVQGTIITKKLVLNN